MLRITNGMMANTLLRNLNNNLLSMDELQRQMSSNSKINKPSDDPAGIVKVLRFQTNITEGEQFLSNIDEAKYFMQTTDDSLNSLTEIMHSIRELTVKAASTQDPDAYIAIADQINELNEQAKMVANASYGSKYIFSGTNVTESPYQNGRWLGNDKLMELEIGVGVKMPINLNMIDFFMGKMNDLSLDGTSGIRGLQSMNLQEGSYRINTTVTPTPVNSKISESQSYLGSVDQNYYFFYQKALPTASMSGGAAATATLTFDRDMYMKNPAPPNNMVAIANGTNLLANFTYTGTPGNLTGASYNAVTHAVDFTFAGAPAVGDTIILNNSAGIYGSDGKQYSPVKAVFNGVNWDYEKSSDVEVSGAQLGAGTAAGAEDSGYNGSIMLEVTAVTPGPATGAPRASLTAANVLTFDRQLFLKNGAGTIKVIPDGEMLEHFTYKQAAGSNGSITSAMYDDTTHSITFTAGNPPAKGDTLEWNNTEVNETATFPGGSKISTEDGKEYTPVKLVYDGANWVYDDKSEVTANLKAHLYDSATGAYKYVDLQNVKLDMEAANGGAVFTLKAADIGDPNFTNDLVIWNNGGLLGGIDPNNSQIKVGDKTVISLTAAQTFPDSQQVEIAYTYTDRYGKKMEEKSQSFSFRNGYFDNQTRELKFFTLGEETGLEYDGKISMLTNNFETSNLNPKDQTSFDFQAGVFTYISDLARKVTVGKLPQTGNELAGNDLRMQDVLLYRATLGARINRLELQSSRLESTQESYTALLGHYQDPDMAEVIMNMKMQEYVYQASLSAGAKIIQPSLLDFLR